jgi:hypothetical protein
MDKLALSFAKTQALNAVENCNSLAELKALTKSLVQAHFEKRAFIEMLMRQQLAATFTTSRWPEATQPGAPDPHADDSGSLRLG